MTYYSLVGGTTLGGGITEGDFILIAAAVVEQARRDMVAPPKHKSGENKGQIIDCHIHYPTFHKVDDCAREFLIKITEYAMQRDVTPSDTAIYIMEQANGEKEEA